MEELGRGLLGLCAALSGRATVSMILRWDLWRLHLIGSRRLERQHTQRKSKFCRLSNPVYALGRGGVRAVTAR